MKAANVRRGGGLRFPTINQSGGQARRLALHRRTQRSSRGCRRDSNGQRRFLRKRRGFSHPVEGKPTPTDQILRKRPMSSGRGHARQSWCPVFHREEGEASTVPNRR